MFQCHIHHHQGELVCPYLKTRYCYEVVNYGFYSSYVANCKRYNCAYMEVIKYTIVKISSILNISVQMAVIGCCFSWTMHRCDSVCSSVSSN